MGASTTLPPGARQPTPLSTDRYEAGSMPNIVTFGFERVTPPSPLYIQRDDLVVIRAATSLAGGDTVTVTARLLLPIGQWPGQPGDPHPWGDGFQLSPKPQPGQTAVQAAATQSPYAFPHFPGYIQTIQQTIALPSPSTFVTLTVPAAEGYLLSVAVVSANAAFAGQTYVTSFIGRGSPAGVTPSPAQVLMGWWPTTNTPVGWPNPQIATPGSQSGGIISIHIANPSAGADWSFTVPTATRFRLRTVSALLTTAVAAANRAPRFFVKDSGGNIVGESSQGNPITASLAMQVTAGAGVASVNDTTNALLHSIPFHGYDMPASWTLGFSTANLQAADQWSNIFCGLEVWMG